MRYRDQDASVNLEEEGQPEEAATEEVRKPHNELFWGENNEFLGGFVSENQNFVFEILGPKNEEKKEGD